MSDVGKVQKVTEARQSYMPDSTARGRIATLLDSGSFVEIDGFVRADGEHAGVVCGYGAVAGSPVAVFAQDGPVGKRHGAKIQKLYAFALKTGIPVVGIYDSNGARLSEGVDALAAYGEVLRQIGQLSGVVPQIALVLGTCAGVSSMLACCADYVIMSEKAELFFAAPQDDLSGSAEAAAKAGVAHIVCADDGAACEKARKLLTMLPLNNLAPAPISNYGEPGGEEALRAFCENMDSADPAAIVEAVCDSANTVALLEGFGASVYAAMTTMAGYPCGVVATKGKLDRDACAKIAKVVSVCDAYQLPVLTFLNAEGLESSGQTELCGSIRDMARMAQVYADATTAKLTVVTGAAIGAAFVAFTGADYTIAWPSAVLSPLEPRTAVAFLCGDRISKDKSREQVEAEYREQDASPFAAAEAGHLDDVIDPALTRPALLSALDILAAKRVTKNPKKHANLPL